MELDEAGRAISAANASAIKKALQGIMRALAPMMQLIGMQAAEALPADDTTEAMQEADRRLLEARNVGEWMEASIHRDFTMTADGMFGEGRLTREERIALSSAIGGALDAFRATLEAKAPGLYTRDPYRTPESVVAVAMDEGAVPGGEAQDLATAELIPLQEAALDGNGTALIKLIQPGWGSSGYYPAAVLRRDGPQVFKAGTKMFWNHPTRTEEAERPEGSLNDLASELVEDARYLDDTDAPRGAGLYAPVKVFGPYRAAVRDLAAHIGTSIRASGKARPGEAEGRTGPIIERIVAAQSVDYVTTPGAGGEIVALFEAARPAPASQEDPPMPDDTTLTEAVGALRRLEAQNQQLQAELLRQQASSYRDTKIAALGLPVPVAARVRESVGAAAPTVEGQPLALDTTAFDKLIESAANREILYAQALAPTGTITGMGGAGGWGASRTEPTLEDLQGQTAALFGELGLSESDAKTAAARR